MWAIGVLLGSMVMEGVVVPHRHPRGERGAARGRVVVAVHPPHEEPRPPGRAARGRGRARRARDRARSASCSPRSRATAGGTVWAASAIGLLLDRGRDRARDRDEQPARRRGGAARGRRAHPRATIEDFPAVRRCIHLRTEHLGPDEIVVAAKVEFDPELTVAQLAATIDALEVDDPHRGAARDADLRRARRLPRARCVSGQKLAETRAATARRRRVAVGVASRRRSTRSSPARSCSASRGRRRCCT